MPKIPLHLWLPNQNTEQPQATRVNIIVNKLLHKISPQLQRMLLNYKLQNYDLSIKYVKENPLHVADSLLQTYLTNPDDSTQSKDLEFAIHAMIENQPIIFMNNQIVMLYGGKIWWGKFGKLTLFEHAVNESMVN